MNIGLFAETYYPDINGIATSVLTLKTELEQLGHNVYVFTTTKPGSPEYEHNVFRVPSLPCVFITEYRVGIFYQPRLASVIKKLNLDIIHTHSEFSLGIFGRIMAKELHLPLIHTYHTIWEDYTHYITHNKNLDTGAKAFIRTLTKICCNTVQLVIVPTEKVKELLTEYSVHKDIAVVPTGINLEKFDCNNVSKEEVLRLKKQYGIEPDQKVIIYIGRVSKEKNLLEIIEAMPSYMDARKNVKLVIVGKGPDKEELEKYSRKLPCGERIIFTGGQPWDIIANYYQLGDVFVSASQSETQGLTYIEAMAAGLPVVARKDRCLDGILIDGHNGYSFTDQKEFFQALDEVLFNMETEKFRQNAIDMVKMYSTTQFAKNMEAIYEKVLKNQGAVKVERN